MPKYILPSRVRQAITTISYWREAAKSQAAMHLWPLIALLEKGVNSTAESDFSEEDDRAFWDRYFRLPGDTRADRVNGNFTQDYYVEPLLAALKPSDYPHRSPSSIRVRTFKQSWRAAEANDTNTRWKLAANYVDILIEKVLRKNGQVHLIPAIDVAVWLFRETQFEDNITATALITKLRETLKLSAPDFAKLFDGTVPADDTIFTDQKPEPAALSGEIMAALVPGIDRLTADLAVGEDPAYEEAKSSLSDEDPLYLKVMRLLSIGTSGIILRGTAGTGKTWYAKQVARKLVADSKHIFEVQFHPSYGYQDFVEGYRVSETAKSGFEIVPRVFLEACDAASRVKTPVVLVIDEINRGDPARILGEVLTYIEPDYRGISFVRPFTGKPMSIPKNLLLIGTMNNFDRSITQLDLALLRRFDHIEITPSAEAVDAFLGALSKDQRQIIVEWFESLQTQLPTESGGIGHTYFKNVKHAEDMQTIWHYRMRPYCEQLLELDPDKFENVSRSFDGMYARLTATK